MLAAVLGIDISKVSFRFPVIESARKEVARILEHFNINSGQTLVIVHPGSKGSALEWPRQYFAQLCDRFVEEIGASVIITGGKGEEDVVNEVLQFCSNEINSIIGTLNLKSLVALLSRADLVIANSTGVEIHYQSQFSIWA